MARSRLQPQSTRQAGNGLRLSVNPIDPLDLGEIFRFSANRTPSQVLDQGVLRRFLWSRDRKNGAQRLQLVCIIRTASRIEEQAPAQRARLAWSELAGTTFAGIRPIPLVLA